MDNRMLRFCMETNDTAQAQRELSAIAEFLDYTAVNSICFVFKRTPPVVGDPVKFFNAA